VSAHGRVAAQREPITLEALLGQLESVRRNGEGRWMARCPAHGDRSASLSVRAGDDGRILLHDFGGCSFAEIVDALGVEARQLFPAGAAPAPRRPRPNPGADALAFLLRLQALHTPPPPERLRKELELIGAIILGGARALQDLPPGFSSSRVLSFPLRLLLEAAQELQQQGTPRRWFSPLALARELDRVGGAGYARRNQAFFWARLAIATAREGR
jgi:hypothetical protein